MRTFDPYAHLITKIEFRVALHGRPDVYPKLTLSRSVTKFDALVLALQLPDVQANGGCNIMYDSCDIERDQQVIYLSPCKPVEPDFSTKCVMLCVEAESAEAKSETRGPTLSALQKQARSQLSALAQLHKPLTAEQEVVRAAAQSRMSRIGLNRTTT